jgi:hypothetical protein
LEEAQVGVAASLATLDVLKVIVFALEFGGNVECGEFKFVKLWSVAVT